MLLNIHRHGKKLIQARSYDVELDPDSVIDLTMDGDRRRRKTQRHRASKTRHRLNVDVGVTVEKIGGTYRWKKIV